MNSDHLAIEICKRLDRALTRQQEERQALDLLGEGAAFEAWLAFEARLLMENARRALKLAGTVGRNGATVPRFWIANEYRKVDLYVADLADGDGQDELALEFKLIHNNKNWKSKADEVWNDLFPRSGSRKASIRPRRGRFAVVAVVGKVYRRPARYPGQRDDLARWKLDLEEYLLPVKGWRGRRVANIWSGRVYHLEGPWLDGEKRSFFQLKLLRAH